MYDENEIRNAVYSLLDFTTLDSFSEYFRYVEKSDHDCFASVRFVRIAPDLDFTSSIIAYLNTKKTPPAKGRKKIDKTGIQLVDHDEILNPKDPKETIRTVLLERTMFIQKIV